MFKVTSTLLNPATDNLTIALDDGRNVYRRRSSWQEVGLRLGAESIKSTIRMGMKDKPGFIYNGGLENKQIGDTIQVIFEGDINRPKFRF
jgi:hypothetical protein